MQEAETALLRERTAREAEEKEEKEVKKETQYEEVHTGARLFLPKKASPKCILYGARGALI